MIDTDRILSPTEWAVEEIRRDLENIVELKAAAHEEWQKHGHSKEFTRIHASIGDLNRNIQAIADIYLSGNADPECHRMTLEEMLFGGKKKTYSWGEKT